MVLLFQINVFDLSQDCEDEALTTSLNAEASIRSVTFLTENKLSVILDHEEAFIWQFEDSEPSKNFVREDFTVAIKRKITPWTYIGGCHFDSETKKTYFLAGSSFESNPCLRVLNLKKFEKLKPLADLKSGKIQNSTVRCSVLAKDGATFVTGNENGFLFVWKNEENVVGEVEKSSQSLKAMKKMKISKKPYE